MKLEPVRTFDTNEFGIELDDLKVASFSTPIKVDAPLYIAEPVYNSSIKSFLHYSELVLWILSIIALVHLIARFIIFNIRKNDDNKNGKKIVIISGVIF